MSKVPGRGLRKRAIGLGEFRLLTDGEAEALSGPATSKMLNEAVFWIAWPTQRPSGVRANLTVSNNANERLSVRMRIPLALPTCSHYVLVWGEKAYAEQPEAIRRLDLRDDHTNPDGASWQEETHKHLWSATANNRWAYTPSGIPHGTATVPVGGDDYRAITEAFLAECGITLGPDYKWADPPLDQPAEQTLWELP